MAASIVGMLLAAAGYLPPVAGAIAQEVIDVVVVVNALRVAIRPKELTDF
jgi:cation transport ATPase